MKIKNDKGQYYAVECRTLEENSVLLCFIDFLHEFQNIIHALTNKELNIEL